MKIRAHAAPWHAGVDLLISNGASVCVGLVMKDIGAVTANPSVSISMEEAQTLMDDLWMAGLRPTEGAGSAGSLRATERHLEDMREISFKLLDDRLGPGDPR